MATFFGLSGSMAGGTISMRGTGKSGGTKPSMENTAASYSARCGRRNCQAASLGWEVSMWQRHTQRARSLPCRPSRAAGWGSWMKTMSAPSRESRRVSALWRLVSS